MVSKKKIDISVVIPVYTGYKNLKYLLPAINKQALLPREIVIIDSCSHKEVKELMFLIVLWEAMLCLLLKEEKKQKK